MAEMIPIKEAAACWNITERRVATLCKDGKIVGAEKQGKRWMIPAWKTIRRIPPCRASWTRWP